MPDVKTFAKIQPFFYICKSFLKKNFFSFFYICPTIRYSLNNLPFSSSCPRFFVCSYLVFLAYSVSFFCLLCPRFSLTCFLIDFLQFALVFQQSIVSDSLVIKQFNKASQSLICASSLVPNQTNSSYFSNTFASQKVHFFLSFACACEKKVVPLQSFLQKYK